MKSLGITFFSRLSAFLFLIGTVAVWYLMVSASFPPVPVYSQSESVAQGIVFEDVFDEKNESTVDIKKISARLWQRPLEDPPLPVPPAPPPPPPQPQLKIELVATVIKPGANSVVLRDRAGRERYCVIGEKIDSARVIGISDGSVVLRQGSHDFTLMNTEVE